jgi:hypothetical protein
MWLFGQTSVISAPGYLPAAGSGKALGARRVASLAVTQLFPKLPWIWEGPISVLNVKQGIFPLDGEEDYARSKSGSPTLYGDHNRNWGPTAVIAIARERPFTAAARTIREMTTLALDHALPRSTSRAGLRGNKALQPFARNNTNLESE